MFFKLSSAWHLVIALGTKDSSLLPRFGSCKARWPRRGLSGAFSFKSLQVRPSALVILKSGEAYTLRRWIALLENMAWCKFWTLWRPLPLPTSPLADVCPCVGAPLADMCTRGWHMWALACWLSMIPDGWSWGGKEVLLCFMGRLIGLRDLYLCDKYGQRATSLKLPKDNPVLWGSPQTLKICFGLACVPSFFSPWNTRMSMWRREEEPWFIPSMEPVIKVAI